jgi:hypothetical protein
MLDLMENEVAVVGELASQLGMRARTPETSARFPFLLALRDAYLVSESSWVAEEPSAQSNESDGGRPDSQRFMSHTAPLTKVKCIDARKETLRVQALQRWTGRVEKVMKDRFVAIVSDVTTPSNPDEEVELDIEDVPSSDRALVTKGAVFYWAVVYRDSKAGQRWKSESIRFARHPKLSQQDVQDIFSEADAIAAILESA